MLKDSNERLAAHLAERIALTNDKVGSPVLDLSMALWYTCICVDWLVRESWQTAKRSWHINSRKGSCECMYVCVVCVSVHAHAYVCACMCVRITTHVYSDK